MLVASTFLCEESIRIQFCPGLLRFLQLTEYKVCLHNTWCRDLQTSLNCRYAVPKTWLSNCTVIAYITLHCATLLYQITWSYVKYLKYSTKLSHVGVLLFSQALIHVETLSWLPPVQWWISLWIFIFRIYTLGSSLSPQDNTLNRMCVLHKCLFTEAALLVHFLCVYSLYLCRQSELCYCKNSLSSTLCWIALWIQRLGLQCYKSRSP